jgi:hypothetical protein
LTLKRSLAIFFLLIFLFHAGGYYAVFLVSFYQAEKVLTQRANAGHYTAADELTLSLSFSLPYPVHAGEYKPSSPTSFEYQGEQYTVVRQKVDGDLVQLVCVRNVRQSKLVLAMTDYSKIVNNLPSGRALQVIAKFFKDFQPTAGLVISDTITSQYITHPQRRVCLMLPEADYPVISPPPEKQS